MADEEKVPNEQPSTGQPEGEPLKVSRRDFLVGAGMGVIATGAVAGGYIALRPPERVEVIKEAQAIPKEEAAAQVVNAELPATMRAVALNIDGKSYDVVVDVRESLWDTMTDKLGLGNSANLGCDRAQCGACAVLVDGRAVNGCTILSARMGRGQQILTVNGISKGPRTDDLHPIARAYWQEGGFQCGICTRGFIMSTYSLLSRNPNPSEDDIREALAGNICRCSEYPKIFDAVLKAAEEMRANA
jgi:aerobic-type carbon monoxide dehydrogenase small subunit (CoxS/CutS family)